ncbi:LCP family protein [Thermasporomyces composti]|uniref:LytR family transcriptional attenuator n=1 Tax=Thermasporomyces composti TaxID=696763 RepID=A0A3D9VAY6_THECX|nr:LCP family protein [Thermasporomyces composti]REF36175.1 LytR family transcriptional attenuator [Thermasporomyces composti]
MSRPPEEYGTWWGTPPPSARQEPRSFARALGLTVLGALVPGAGLWAAGRRKLGLTILAIFVLLCAGAVYLATHGRLLVLHWIVRPEALSVIAAALPLLGVAWALVVLTTYRSLRPSTTSTLERVTGYTVAITLALAILAPLAVGGRYALVQKDLIEHVFADTEPVSVAAATTSTPTPASDASPGSTASASASPSPSPRPDPWKGRDRVNILLLGGDGGPDRVGIRTDTVILASIDVHTGNTLLIGLPRNLSKIPFPPDSPLRKAYPTGKYEGEGDYLEWILTSIYENLPAAHPGLLKVANPGAEATKHAVAGALNLPVHYYVLVNLKGFEKLIDAIGGITVNVNHRVAIGGVESEGLRPGGWIEKGPNQHLDGHKALWFARGRYGADDYQRMERQRCVVKAIIDQVDPVTFLTRFEAIATTTKDLILTDIPADLLPALVDLSLKVKQAEVSALTFTNKIIKTSNPDYALMRSMVRNALEGVGSGAVGKSQPRWQADSLDEVCAYAPEES